MSSPDRRESRPCFRAGAVAGLLLAALAGVPSLAQAGPLEACTATCTSERNGCMQDADSGTARGQCARTFLACTADCKRRFPPPPAATAITSIDPLWGWSGDQVRITGASLFQGLSITVGGLPATIVSTNQAVSSRGWDIIDFNVPLLHSDVLGPKAYPLVVNSGGKTFPYTFAYSPMVMGGASKEISGEGPFTGLGYTTAQVSIDRETGQISGRADAENYGGPFDTLAFSVACAFFDAQGKALGSMLTKGFAAPGVPVFTTGPRHFEDSWTETIRPVAGLDGALINQARFAVVKISVTPAQVLDTQVTDILNFGSTMAQFVGMFVK